MPPIVPRVLRFARFLPSIFIPFAHLALAAALPELSSIEPIEYDEAAQRVVARGDARLEFGEARLRADRITYYQEYGMADAVGGVEVTWQGNRLLADRLSYELESEIFSIDRLKSGQWPFYVSGVAGGGTPDNMVVEGGAIYYGNPGPFTPNVAADSFSFIEGGRDTVRIDHATFRIGSVPVFYLPGYTYRLSESPYHLDLNLGSDNRLGTYVQSTTLLPLGKYLRAGANFDAYTRRGVLAGPAAQYVYESETQQIVGALSTGFIDDQGDVNERGVDRLNRPIGDSREFVEWRHQHAIGERLSTTTSFSYWSDSDVTRDFREGIFQDNQLPDNFAEAAYAGDNYVVSLFGRFNFNDFQLIQERLPELRIDLLPMPIFATGAYHRGSLSYVRLREEFDGLPPFLAGEMSEADRFDATYRIERPVHLAPWLTFTPLAGARLTSYENQFQSAALPFAAPLATDGQRETFEAGFDLEMRSFRTYDTVNRTWAVDGLRHLLKPVIRYRYFSDPDDLGESVSIDRRVFDLERPVLDLSDLRHVDQITETHLARLGLENLFQTKAEGYGSRTLATLNFYQDVLFEKGRRYDGDKEDTFNASWIDFQMQPAPWLKFDMASRFRTESLKLEELRTRMALLSGEIWELGLGTDLIDQQIDQYRMDFIYRFNERYSFLSDVRFDADNGELNNLSLGLRSRVSSVWEIMYALTLRENSRREDDVSFNVRFRLMPPRP